MSGPTNDVFVNMVLEHENYGKASLSPEEWSVRAAGVMIVLGRSFTRGEMTVDEALGYMAGLCAIMPTDTLVGATMAIASMGRDQ